MYPPFSEPAAKQRSVSSRQFRQLHKHVLLFSDGVFGAEVAAPAELGRGLLRLAASPMSQTCKTTQPGPGAATGGGGRTPGVTSSQRAPRKQSGRDKLPADQAAANSGQYRYAVGPPGGAPNSAGESWIAPQFGIQALVLARSLAGAAGWLAARPASLVTPSASGSSNVGGALSNHQVRT